MADASDLTYFEVVRTVSPVPAGVLNADVQFEAQITEGVAIQADLGVDIIEILAHPVLARIIDGVLTMDARIIDGVATTNPTPGVQLLSAAEVAIEGGFSYLATFTQATINGSSVPMKSLTFPALGSSGTFDLKDAAPIAASTAVPTSRGAVGYSAKWVVVDEGPPVLWQQYVAETSSYVGEPTSDLVTGVLRPIQGDNTAGIFGSEIIRNSPRDGYGSSYSVGDVGNSFGFSGTPTVAETPVATTTATVTFPLTNGTIPVSDLGGFQFDAGSFTLGGRRVSYLGRSATSGAGNLTGCYTHLDANGVAASGTVASGTSLSNTPTGYMGYVNYKRFGYDGRPVFGSTQAYAGVGSWKSPTVDDSAECGSWVAVMADAGFQQSQLQTVTGGEMTSQLGGNWLMPGGVNAPLVGGGVRTALTATDRAKSVQGLRVSLSHDPDSHVDNYAGIYQTVTAYQGYGLVNNAAGISAGSGLTIAFDNATHRPPTPSTGYPGSVIVGANADGIGGQVVTYTGITGSGATGTLTGATAASAIADNARISNRVYGVSMVDPIVNNAGFALGASGYSGAINLALRGLPDSLGSMLAITGPTQADSVAGGLCQVRLNAGSDQTQSVVQWFDPSGNQRGSINYAGDVVLRGRKFIGQDLSNNSLLVLDGALGTIDVGHASDTTLSRSAAGQLAVEGIDIPTTNSAHQVSNKTFVDNLTWFANAADVTKKAALHPPGGQSANSIRTHTLPGSDSTLASTTLAETFSNKVVQTVASTTSVAGLRVAHGIAPTAPVNGDVWSTTAGLFIQINGVTKTVTLT